MMKRSTEDDKKQFDQNVILGACWPLPRPFVDCTVYRLLLLSWTNISFIFWKVVHLSRPLLCTDTRLLRFNLFNLDWFFNSNCHRWQSSWWWWSWSDQARAATGWWVSRSLQTSASPSRSTLDFIVKVMTSWLNRTMMMIVMTKLGLTSWCILFNALQWNDG